MKATIRPNVRFRELQANQAGMASPAAIDALATVLTLGAVAVVVGLIVLVQRVSEFWAGVILGGFGGVSLVIGLIAVGVCLAGGSMPEAPRGGVCDRGVHR